MDHDVGIDRKSIPDEITTLKRGDAVWVALLVQDTPNVERVLSWLGVVETVDLIGIRILPASCVTDSRKVPLNDGVARVIPWLRIDDITVIEMAQVHREIERRATKNAVAA